MNIIKKIGISNIGVFKELEFEVPLGITYVYGKNMLNGGNPNAAGKSLFASSISEIFYDTPLVGTKQDKIRMGERSIEFLAQGKDLVRIVSSFNGKTEKLEVLKNGENATKRTSTLTREFIDTLWPVSLEDYVTYGYIDSIVPHPLARGSTTERKSFFTSFFNLDRMDDEKRKVEAELKKVKRVRAAYNELYTTFENVRQDMLTKADRLKLEAEYEVTRERVELLRAEQERVQRVQRLLDFEDYASLQISELAELCPNLDDFYTLSKGVQRRLSKARQAQEQMDEWRAYRKAVERFKEETEGLDMTTPLKELEALSKRYQSALYQVESFDDSPRPKRMSAPQEPDLAPKEEWVVARAKARHQLDHALKFKDGKCFECGQAVKATDPATVKEKLSSAVAAIKEWDAYEESQLVYSRHVDRLRNWEKEQAEIEHLKVFIDSNRLNHQLYLKRMKLRRPEKVEKPEDAEEIAPLEKAVALFRFCESHVETIRSLHKLTEADRELSFDASELNTLQDRAANARTKLDVHNTVKKRASEMRQRLAGMGEELAQEQALELILDGYNDKAMKKMAIESISQHLMALVNKYAELVFEDYKFEFVWGSQIQILVHRPSGTSDVRKLSGAESKLFTIILVLSLLSFVPKAKRLSMLILDEPTSSFSEETTELFHRLLPHLNQIIPSILVITPKSSERLEGANEMTVLRTHRGATIVKGHPSQC